MRRETTREATREMRYVMDECGVVCVGRCEYGSE